MTSRSLHSLEATTYHVTSSEATRMGSEQNRSRSSWSLELTRGLTHEES